MRIHLLLAAALALPVADIAAAPREYRIGPAPAWVLPAKAHERRAAASEISAGAYWRIVDRQVRVDRDTSEEYYRYAIELLNERGVEDNAQLTIDFDPTYQSLVVHQVSIRRAGSSVDALPTARASVLQRETDLEDSVYDGSKTLNLILADVRVGDVIDYSFSLRGQNPLFGERFYDSYSSRWSDPIAFMRLRLLHPGTRSIRHKAYAGAPEPRVRDLAGERELLWEAEDLPGLINEDDRPAWHVLYPYVQFSEAQNWSEVSRWAHALFNTYRPEGATLLANTGLAEARTLPAGERVVAALRFVQEQIRYTAIEIGRGTHEPTDPAVVLARRFGDCKDKSLLLVHLLRALDVSADTVLVDNRRGQALDALLPSPHAFNHAIVRARVESRDYWLDPTLAPQGGKLKDLHQPDYGFALVVAADASGLQRMPGISSEQRVQEVHDVFDLRSGISAPGQLTVTSVYTAREADRMRARFAGSSRAQIEKNYVNYYARSYPVESLGPIEVRDDREANRFRTVERYRLARSFQDGDDGDKELNVRGYALDDMVRKPETPVRHTPLAVGHPVHVRHVVEVRLPEAWQIANESGEIRDPAFQFRFRRSYDKKDDVLHLEYEYRSLRDHVTPDALEAYLANLDKVDEEYGYWLSYDPDAVDSTGYVPAFFATVVLALAAGLWLMRRVYLYSPPPRTPAVPDAPRGIRGWLVLPAIGCCLSPLFALYLAWSLSLHFDPDAWARTESVVAAGWVQSFPHPYLVTCFVLSILLACLEFMVAFLFFRKRTSVPYLYPVVLWSGVVVSALVLLGMDPEAIEQPVVQSLAEIMRDVLAALIWTAYFARSNRVRATFVETLPEGAPGTDSGLMPASATASPD